MGQIKYLYSETYDQYLCTISQHTVAIGYWDFWFDIVVHNENRCGGGGSDKTSWKFWISVQFNVNLTVA